MTGTLFLLLAIVSEVFGSAMLKLSAGFTLWLPSLGVVAGFVAAFAFLGLALKSIPLSRAYAVWSGLGTALTAAVGVIFFHEHLGLWRAVGIALIVLGVVVLNASSRTQHSEARITAAANHEQNAQ